MSYGSCDQEFLLILIDKDSSVTYDRFAKYIVLLYGTRIICTVYCTIIYKIIWYEQLNLPSSNALVHPMSGSF